jgi:UPF0755 protein
MRKKIVIFSLLLILGVLSAWVEIQYRLMQKQVLVLNDQTFEINKGDSLETIVMHLKQQTIKINPLGFKLYAYQQHLATHIKAGEYDLSKGMTAADILQLFYTGKTHQYAITFPEGWSFKQVLQAVNANSNLQHFLVNTPIDAILKSLGADKNHPEGLFFPDTYFFEKRSTDVELLKRAYDKMQHILNEEWQKREPALPLDTPYQALILASIIEKETAVAEERKQIAGVFIRRLKKGMLLQTDPTVIYGMGDDYHGDIRRKDLHETTPYNTYVIAGLPPTPIAMPGKQAIIAALHPDESNALYFVSSGNGHHMFSSTLAEHEKWVERYQK